MTAVRDRNESAWLLPNDGTRTNHRLRADMRRFADRDEVDLVVVGCGAGGSTLLQRLARRGWRVVGLDAGPFWDPDADWVSDEAGSHHLYWTEPRVISGSDPVPLGSNNSGRGVGGSMVHYAGYTPRFHPSDFATWTDDGVGADWPIGYDDLRPYYEDIEAELPVAGEDWPWGDPHTYPHRPHPVGGNGEIFLRGALRVRHHRQGRTGRHHQRPLRQPAALHLPRLLPPGLQGQRQGIPADHPHPRRARPRRRDPGRLHGHRDRHRRADRPGHRRALPPRRGAPFPAGAAGRGGRLLDRDPAAAAELRLTALPRRPVQRLRPGRPLPHGPGRAADGGPVRRRGADVQGARRPRSAASSSTRPTRPSPTSAGSPSRPSRRCRSPGPSTSPRRATGEPRCAST